MIIRNLTKYYGTACGIEDISLTLIPGMIYGVLGHNGSGKTTLFRSVLGLIKPDQGDVGMAAHETIGYVPENRALFKDITVEKHILFLAKLRKVSFDTVQKRFDRLLELFEIQDYRQRVIGTLSKGNQQKVQFICALIHNPTILILDEPMSGLDVFNMNLLKQNITRLSKEGTKIIMSSHQYDELEEFCDELMILNQGKNVLSGNVKTLKRSYDYLYISITYDENKRYQNEKEVIGTVCSGHLCRYKVRAKDDGIRLIQTICKDRDVSTIKIESVSLKDMVSECYE